MSKKSPVSKPSPAQVEEAAKKVVKQKRYRPPRPEQTVQLSEGDNRSYIQNSLRIARLPKIDIRNNEQVTARIYEYFDICAESNMKPSVAGMALALGVDRRRLWEIRTGVIGSDFEIQDTLKRAVQILDVQMNDYMQNGKINPVSGIFLMKNNFGYSNKQEITVTAQNPLGEEEKDTKQLEEQYLDSVVVVPEDEQNDS